jgi:hypothetical protein
MLPAIGGHRQPRPPLSQGKDDEVQGATHTVELPNIRPRPSSAKQRLLSTTNTIEQRARAQKKLDAEIFDRAFLAIDTDGSGTVTASEILKVTSVFGKHVDKAKFWTVFKEADTDGSGSIDRDEFTALMLRLTDANRRRAAKHFLTRKNNLKRAGMLKGTENARAENVAKKKDARTVAAHHHKKPKNKGPEGSRWMSEMTEQFRSLTEIYQKRRKWADQAESAKLLVKPLDPRLRTVLGRQLLVGLSPRLYCGLTPWSHRPL